MENQLTDAASPYLRQHADNPVAWQPWTEETLQLAEERDVPIFLSIGYSACHWCHVMEDESFEDPEIAEILNEEFVPIKVDREERPDVDSVYMTACQLTRGQGGWPLSAWLTPDGRPFQVGTYFPPESRQGMPGFGDVLRGIADAWNDPEERQKLEDRADQLSDAIEGELEDTPETPGAAPDDAFIETAADAAVRRADRQHGGWGTGQKFPQPGRISVLLRAADRTGNETYRDVACETLDAMASGGLYDHVGGGFHRYCVDREWTVPHFEKMLYDNAEIPRAFLAGYAVTGNQRYAEITTETFEFLRREMQHPAGGFYATLDAESQAPSGEREEGAFYTWTPGEVEAALDDETDAALFCDRYGITEKGNFEGRTVPTESAPIDRLAREYDLDDEAVRTRLDRTRETLFTVRSDRPRPPRDEKVLAGWNGLVASAFAEGSLVLGGDHAVECAETAAEAIAFCRSRLWDEDTNRLSRRLEGDTIGIDGYLEDYAFLGRGALNTYEATGDVAHLAFALELGRTISDAFYDETAGTLYFTPADGESLVARPQELTDTSTPSSAGVAAELLSKLEAFAPSENFGAIAETVIETHASTLESEPLSHATLVLAADDRAVGHLELTVAANGLTDEHRGALAGQYLPRRLLSIRPPTEGGLESWIERLGLTETPPIWANREATDGEPTVYACRSFSCSPPKREMKEALDWAT
ncbi:MAG: thioredoxin domain-containing protein [Natronomonas sp.]